MEKEFPNRALCRLNATPHSKSQLGATQSHAPKRWSPIHANNNANVSLPPKFTRVAPKKLANLAA